MVRSAAFLLIISLTGFSSALSAENLEDVFWEAHIAYKMKEYSRGAALYNSILEKGYQHPNAVYNIAGCYALAGQFDKAFEYLNVLCRDEFMSFDAFLQDADFKPLQKDPRWAAIVSKCQAAEEVYISRCLPELYRLYNECSENPHLAEEASKKVIKFLSSKQLKSSKDYYHAAAILIHLYDEPASLKLAQKLAEKADRIKPNHPDARLLRAAAVDRFLWASKLPQIYGSQMKQDDNKKWTDEPFDEKALTDEQRAAGGFLSLSTLKKRLQLRNEKGIE